MKKQTASNTISKTVKNTAHTGKSAAKRGLKKPTAKLQNFEEISQEEDSNASRNADYARQINAILANQAVIEFQLDGTIITANQNFLDAAGYTLTEIQGRHHSIFVDAVYKQSSEYRAFWEKLARGEAQGGEFRRIRRDGSDLWLLASYNPIPDANNKPVRVVKYANYITESKRRQADSESQLKSISTYQAVIEFKLDGTIVTANQNFLDATGYSLTEIQGRHHSIFVEPAYKQSNDYRLFWDRLGRGEADAGQYKRIRRDGTELWLQASYNPIFDLSGKPCRVVKYASDITPQKLQEQQMARTLAETTRVMKALAAGDLRESMEGTYEGEFAILSEAVNGCVDNLRNTIEQIRHSVSTITVSSTQIASGNLDLSQRTEEQASSLTETAANMEQITQTVKQNADNARQANSLASGARDQAEKGGAVVKNAIAAMSAINEASKRIADIIGVIDEIAFQTNLLALNAAVEAARAGEQGRGFAVVASEVRNLAQRSAGAAKEIKSLIKDSVVRVDDGSRLVNESGATLEQIVGAAKKVSDIIAEIAAASTQQSAGIEKVTEAVQQMDIAVQQNSALVEQTSAASNMMEDQARSMSTMIEFFKLASDATTLGTVLKKSAGKPVTRTPVKSQRPPVKRTDSAPPSSSAFEMAMADEF